MLVGGHFVCTWIASQTVSWSGSVHSTRCRTRAGIRSQSPGRISRNSTRPSIRRRAAPLSSATHSSVCWSYHSSGGVTWPRDTIRSTRTPGVCQSTLSVSTGDGGGSGVNRLPVETVSVFVKHLQGGFRCCHFHPDGRVRQAGGDNRPSGSGCHGRLVPQGRAKQSLES